jgi:hypothetical protein
MDIINLFEDFNISRIEARLVFIESGQQFIDYSGTTRVGSDDIIAQ